MDLRRQIAIVRRWLPLLVASVVLAGGGAFMLSNLEQKVYEAKATLIVGQSLSGVNPDYSQLLASQRLSTTYASVATKRPILGAVVEQLGLDVTPDELRGRVNASAPQDNTLLIITARDALPDVAADIANALADQLIAASPAIQGRQAEFQKSIDADLLATQAQINQTQEEVQRLSDLESLTAAQESRLRALEDRLVTLRSTYATLLSFSSGNASNLLSVVEPAIAVDAPVSPRPLYNTLLAAAIGLLLGAAIVFLLEYLDDTIKTVDDVLAATRLSTLGTIPRMKGDRGREIYRLATLVYPRSNAAEAYRTLRTNIEFSAVDEPIKTLLVTSSVPREGKTVTAANLAVAFAQAGRRVLLVDADLRKPGVHGIFDLPNVHGLTTLLRSETVGVDTVSQPTEQANLRILTTGPLPPNPAEILGSQRMRVVLDRLQESADLVIFDSAPVQAVTDSVVLSSFVDGTLFVIDARHSRRGTVRLAMEALARAGATVYGVALNRVPEHGTSEYAPYYGSGAGTAAALGERSSPSA